MNKEKDPIDVVHLEVPLLIRLFEYAREDATKDEDLHVVTENLIKLSKEGPLTMACYDKVLPAKEEETSAGAIAQPDVRLFSGKDKPKMKKPSLAESFSRIVEEGLSKEKEILQSILSLDFESWYRKEFKNFLSSDGKSPTKEQILNDIKKLFKV
jgi:hypothetical protein